jgi:biopolymer transport protein ExbB
MQAVVQAFSQGGECMYIIALVSVVGVAIFIERFVALFFKYNVNAGAFMSQIQKLVAANNIERAVKLCNAAPDAALPRVIKSGLARADGDASEVRGAIEEAVLEVVPLLTKRARSFLGVAIVAAGLGLFGSVIGLIRAFSSLGQAGPELDAVGLTVGATSSMYPMAFGLAVSIVFALAYFSLSSVATRIVNEINLCSAKLINSLAARQRSGDAPAREGRPGEVLAAP